MKNKFYILTLASAAAALCGCVQVDEEVATSPSQYWKAPKDAVPAHVIRPEQIKTDTILKDGAKAESSKDAKAKNANVKDAKIKNSKSNDVAKKSKIEMSAAEKLLSGSTLDLSELVDIALENNTQTRMYWFQAKSYAASLGKANSGYYPQVSVSGQFYRSKTHPSLGYNLGGLQIGSYYETAFGPSAEINWLLYDFGKREAQVDSAREALRAANYDYNQSIQDVVLSVNTAYYSFYQAVGSVKSAQMDIEDAKTAYESAKQRLENGVGNKQDMLNAFANYRNAEYTLETARAAVETARAQLANAMGIRVSDKLRVSDAVKIPTSKTTSKKIDALIAQAMRERQNLLASYAQLRKSSSDIEVARRNFLPQIGAAANATYLSYTDNQRSDQYAYQAGLTASWSIFEGFTRKYELISAKAAERAQAQSLKAAEIQVISDVWTYYHTYQSALKQVVSAQSAVEANQEAFNATKVGYDSGVNTINDFLNAQYRLAQARQQKVSAEATLCKSIAQLAHSTGALIATTAPDSLPSIAKKQPAKKAVAKKTVTVEKK